jgi:lysozyme family protein
MMTPTIRQIIENVMKAEQGYVNDEFDGGGETNYGITVAVARANGFAGEMKTMTREFARGIYEKRYVVEPWFDRVAELSPVLGEELVDTGVNMGPAVPAMMLQRWLNGFNDSGSKYQDVFVDGRLGPVSIEALKAFLAWRGKEGESVMLMALNSTQGVRYLDIAEKNPTQERFLYGWMRTRVANILRGMQ